MDQMIERVHGKMSKMRIRGFLARRFHEDIPNLKRWVNR